MGLGPHHPACPCLMCADRRVRAVYYSASPDPENPGFSVTEEILSRPVSKDPLVSFEELMNNDDYRALAMLRIRTG
jgi:hypothetical protein